MKSAMILRTIVHSIIYDTKNNSASNHLNNSASNHL